MPVRLTLGHSPDSDDAFMFHGLASGQVGTADLTFEHILRDIETLNDWAGSGRLDVTAISVHAYAHVRDRYAILTHGASMGDGYGPMLVRRADADGRDLSGGVVAVPGLRTSAMLALRLYWPAPVTSVDGSAHAADGLRYLVLPFDEIMEAVADGQVDAGLLIHEGQLTHEELGLRAVVDLGKWWKEATGLPLPLGVNAIRRDLPADIQRAASAALRGSVEHGLRHRTDALAHAMSYARDMSRDVADRFVSMYVNDMTVDMGATGREAIRRFLAAGAARGFVQPVDEIDFVD